MGKKNKFGLLSNIASLGIVQIANYVFPLISLPIISRIIGPDKFGVINYASTFIAYFILLVSYGFDLTATRRIAQNPDDKELRDKVFSEVLIAKLYLFLISIIIFLPCLSFIGPLKSEKSVAIFSFLTVISFVFTQNWLFQAMQNLKRVAILNFIGKFIFTLFVLLIVRQKADYVWQPLIIGLSQILVSLLSMKWAIKTYDLTIKKVSSSRIWELLKEERTVFFSMVVISLYTTTNTVVLGLMRNTTEVGYYTAASRLMDVANTVINIPLAQALFPFIGKAFGKDNQIGVATVQRITPIICIFTLISCLGMFALGPLVLKMFYGNAFEASIPVFKIICFLPMIVALSNIFGIQVMLNLKMDKAFFYITFIGAVCGLCLNFLMIHYYGYIGTAWNCLIVEVFITSAMFIYIKNKGVNPFNKVYFSVSGISQEIRSLKIKNP